VPGSNLNNRAAGAPSVFSGEAATVQISRPGQLLSKLQQLKLENPLKFTQLLSDTAGKLRAISQEGGGDHTLARLAAGFQKAADSGDLSALQQQFQSHAAGPAAGYAPFNSKEFHVAHDSLTGQEKPLTPVPGASPFSSLLAALNRALAG
jgi:hypothetical protein